MGEHTKGPWEAVPARGYEKRGWVEVVAHRNRPVVVVDAFERHSCDESECPECHHGVRITPEDARLIAAAPELLEALEGLADIEDKSFADNCYCACCGEHPAHGQPFGGHADNCALVAARLAIAKARGTDGHVRQRRDAP